MSAYTPTTDDIRSIYVNVREELAEFPEAARVEASAEFGRWLAAHDAEMRADSEGETAERLSLLLWHLTGGRLSKSTYDVQTMVNQIEATFEQERIAGVVAEEPEGFERVQRFADIAAGNFDSELDYDGAEIKRRILMDAHNLDPEHGGAGERCLVCEDDLKVDG